MAGSFAVTTFVMKNSLMDNLSTDYVRTAIAKGLSFRKAVFGHAVRNSLIPIATSFGNNIAVILAGSFLIERIYNIDGFGLLGYESLVVARLPRRARHSRHLVVAVLRRQHLVRHLRRARRSARQVRY